MGNNDVAIQCLSLLVIDLGYDEEPLNGHAPIRHQMAWKYVEDILGKEETLIQVEIMKKYRKG